MKRRITMVAGTHLTALDRKMINAALDADTDEVHTKHGSKLSKTLHVVPTDKKTEMERYRQCTWNWQREGLVEQHAVKGELFYVWIVDPDKRFSQFTVDIIELP